MKTIDKGNRVERTARGMIVCALALACGACGSDEHSPPGGGSAGNAGTGDSASMGGDGNVGGTTHSGGSTASAGAPSDGGEGGEGNDGDNAGDGNIVGGGGDLSDGGSGGHSGGSVLETGGGGGTQSGGSNSSGSGGSSTAGTDAGGTGGISSGGANFGGENTTGGRNSAGAGSGGTEPSGGTSFGGNNAGGSEPNGGTSPGGTNSGGSEPNGGTNSGGTNSGGSEPNGGTNPGGTNSGGTGGAPTICGDSVLSATEQCDDGNTKNLDGCSASCAYEVVDRMTTLSLQSGSAPASCSPTTNALGRAFSAAVLLLINNQIKQAISDGSLNNLIQFDGLEDLTGASDDSSLALGVLPGFIDPANGGWPGTPFDFWFRVPSASVNAQGLPLNSMSGSLIAGDLSAGPGLLKLPLALDGGSATFSVTNARLLAKLSTPSIPAPPPSNLAPGLTVFQSIAGSGSSQGICGNVTVESLAHIPVPASLAGGTGAACGACNGSHVYTACAGDSVEPGCNSMLDVLVGGCRAAVACTVFNVVSVTQPDVPAPGNASVTPLSLGAGNSVPSDQSTGNNAAYSSYFKFDANRAHITGVQ